MQKAAPTKAHSISIFFCQERHDDINNVHGATGIRWHAFQSCCPPYSKKFWRAHGQGLLASCHAVGLTDSTCNLGISLQLTHLNMDKCPEQAVSHDIASIVLHGQSFCKVPNRDYFRSGAVFAAFIGQLRHLDTTCEAFDKGKILSSADNWQENERMPSLCYIMYPRARPNQLKLHIMVQSTLYALDVWTSMHRDRCLCAYFHGCNELGHLQQ